MSDVLKGLSEEFKEILRAYCEEPSRHFHLLVAADWLEEFRPERAPLAGALRAHAAAAYAPQDLSAVADGMRHLTSGKDNGWAWHQGSQCNEDDWYEVSLGSRLDDDLWAVLPPFNPNHWRERYSDCLTACEAMWEALEKYLCETPTTTP